MEGPSPGLLAFSASELGARAKGGTVTKVYFCVQSWPYSWVVFSPALETTCRLPMWVFNAHLKFRMAICSSLLSTPKKKLTDFNNHRCVCLLPLLGLHNESVRKYSRAHFCTIPHSQSDFFIAAVRLDPYDWWLPTCSSASRFSSVLSLFISDQPYHLLIFI